MFQLDQSSIDEFTGKMFWFENLYIVPMIQILLLLLLLDYETLGTCEELHKKFQWLKG